MNDHIEKYLLGLLTSVQKSELLEQIADDPEVKNEFVGMLNSCAMAASSASEYDALQTHSYLKNFRKRKNRKKAKVFFINLSRYAAILVAGMLIAWGTLRQPQVVEKQAVVYQKLTVPAGQRSMLTLADGTTVWVNARSTLEYPGVFEESVREVILTGEAYFDVAPDPETPFIVKSGNFRTKVTGTQFNIFAYGDFFDVSLVEGQVKVYETGAAKDTVILNRNERVVWTDGGLVKKGMNDADHFLWKEGIYFFDDMSFGAIVEKLQLYYDVKIHVANQTLLKHRVTGKFRQRDGIENVLKVIQMGYPFKYRKSEDGSNIYIQ